MSGTTWSVTQLLTHPRRNQLLRPVNTIVQKPATLKVESKAILYTAPPENGLGSYTFTVKGEPLGKPRMTRSDKWKQRPAVLRYRDYADRIRAAAGQLPVNCLTVSVLAFMPMPDSWSTRKRDQSRGMVHRQRPDWDNIGKAVCDALFTEDSILGGGTVWKFWCDQAEARTQITVLYTQ